MRRGRGRGSSCRSYRGRKDERDGARQCETSTTARTAVPGLRLRASAGGLHAAQERPHHARPPVRAVRAARRHEGAGVTKPAMRPRKAKRRVGSARRHRNTHLEESPRRDSRIPASRVVSCRNWIDERHSSTARPRSPPRIGASLRATQRQGGRRARGVAGAPGGPEPGYRGEHLRQARAEISCAHAYERRAVSLLTISVHAISEDTIRFVPHAGIPTRQLAITDTKSQHTPYRRP